MDSEARAPNFADRPIREYGLDGAITYYESDTASIRLGRQIDSLFGEGLFQKVTTEKLEAQAVAAPVNEAEAAGEDEAAGETQRTIEVKDETATLSNATASSGQLSYDEMSRLKAEMDARLVNAYFEINSMQELCQSLLPSAPPHPTQQFPYIQEAGTIPLSSLTMTTASEVSSYRIRAIQDGKMAIARNRKGLVECRRAVEDGARRLKGEVMKGKEGYWSALGALAGTTEQTSSEAGQGEEEQEGSKSVMDQDGVDTPFEAKDRWAMLPRWLADGTPDHKQLARDVMIPYAADEAAPHVRRRSIAFINPKFDPTSIDQNDALIFPNRRHRRLRTTLRTMNGISRSRLTSSNTNGDDSATESFTQQRISRSLEEAQAEAFDEEIYEGIVREARSPNVWDAAVTMDRIVLRPVAGVELRFEMIHTETDEDEEDANELGSGPAPTASATLLLSMTRLRMLHIYRLRQADRPNTPNPQVAQTIPTAPPLRNILSPVIAYIRYQAFVEQVSSTLTRCQAAVSSLGIDLAIEREDGREAGGMDWTSLIGGDEVHVEDAQILAPGGSIDVVLDGRQIVSILVSTSCQLTLIFSHTTVVSQDIAQLPTYLMPEMQKGIIRRVRDAIADGPAPNGEETRKVVVDEGLGTITTTKVKYHVNASLDTFDFQVRAYKIVRGKEGDKRGKVNEIDFTADKAADVRSWATSLLA